MTSWYVYLLKTARNTLYTGVTTDPKRRLRQHSGDIKGGAKALRGKLPLHYYCIFEVENKSHALRLEAWIKGCNRSIKDKLANEPVEIELPVTAQKLSTELIRQLNSAHH
ncbi:GIY-YIG nuclease family protein [Alteromonas gilva]|uniref:GIY-YIG nuclease family protein n=1 Tax=Alteromonas gilva TaxID=2987522 RepID=A0ABT5KZV9_9ALTE|nr:GIY-YIG nuclease family protein [Alteromonas gilva]MDC8830314.1 GIY-YIG nuclease family protein [Alteromonas gilva]